MLVTGQSTYMYIHSYILYIGNCLWKKMFIDFAKLILLHLQTFSCIISYQKEIIHNWITKSLNLWMFSCEHCDNRHITNSKFSSSNDSRYTVYATVCGIEVNWVICLGLGCTSSSWLQKCTICDSYVLTYLFSAAVVITTLAL